MAPEKFGPAKFAALLVAILKSPNTTACRPALFAVSFCSVFPRPPKTPQPYRSYKSTQKLVKVWYQRDRIQKHEPKTLTFRWADWLGRQCIDWLIDWVPINTRLLKQSTAFLHCQGNHKTAVRSYRPWRWRHFTTRCLILMSNVVDYGV